MRPTWPAYGGPSSRAWLTRQFKDPYVKARLTQSPSVQSLATRFRSRSAFKLMEMDSQYKFIQPGRTNVVIDLGAAPGGWSQVVSAKLGGFKDLGLEREEREERKALDGSGWGLNSPESPPTELWSSANNGSPGGEEDLGEIQSRRPTMIALDLLRIQPIPGVQTLQADFLSTAAESLILGLLPSGQTKADLLLCDMAANSSGNPTRDTEASYTIAQSVFDFATRHLKLCEPGKTNGGSLVCVMFHASDHVYMAIVELKALSFRIQNEIFRITRHPLLPQNPSPKIVQIRLSRQTRLK